MKITVTPLVKFEDEVNSLIENRALLKDDYEDFKKRLAENPELGPTISKTGGVRKTRLKSATKGKSGGFRVCYFYIPERCELYLICIYGKNKQEDLSEEEKKELKTLVTEFKRLLK
jgi:mRNA-degrading endonuclease RelE of RelBE toxin-antitoxin system